MTLHLINLYNTSIFDQLLLEEFLLRSDDKNWCIINRGSPESIVMGISSKIENFVDQDKVLNKKVPVIKRYSGGGTVFVDPNTIFVTYIINKNIIDKQLFPETIHKWAEGIYKDVFTFDGFALKENDYVIHDKKFGGNAQYIKKNRFVHHTTFLWDFKEESMSYLLLPPKTPNYRKARGHIEFLTKLKLYFKNEQTFIKRLTNRLKSNFPIIEVELKKIEIGKGHRISTKKIL